ncbi:response regulator transcription factor [Sphingoaurantiacus capsulatus]|uniref:Response regulator transcription factor n=1 Tax=Sphingoaurantiacus capsulatus TaxID=1771310 RepID=A0ABV7X954_9SPHN
MTPFGPRSVYVVDDDVAVREATHTLLATAGYEPQAFVSGREFLDEADLHGGGCVLLDICMPGPNGLDVQAMMVKRGSNLSVIMVTGHGDVATAVLAMKTGATDFLEKPYRPVALLDAVKRGLRVSAAQVTDIQDSKKRIARLTPRENEVLHGLMAGGSNKSIARQLNVSPRTVEMHRANLMERLGARSLPEALRVAHEAGFSGA